MLISSFVPEGGKVNDYTHEHIMGLLPNAVVERNIFVGKSFAALMSIGKDNGDKAIVRNNTIDKRGYGTAYMFHLTKVRGKHIDMRNNIMLRSKGIKDEEKTPDAFGYLDYNLYVDSPKYQGVIMSKKKEGAEGFGKYSKSVKGAKKLFVNPDIGYPFPYSKEELLSGKVDYKQSIALYRDAYTLRKGSPAINAGSPEDSKDVKDGKVDLGAMEYEK